jgi:hypothetical protein
VDARSWIDLMTLKIRNLPYIKTLDPKLHETITDVAAAVDGLAQRSNVNPTGETTAPFDISRLTVVAQDGVFDIRIFDDTPVQRGIHYFVEYSTTPSFTNPIPIHLGTSRCGREFLGNLTLYWRAYSQYLGSQPSNPIYFGSAVVPTAVIGGGSITGPTPQQSTGSGTASSNGTQGGQGFGVNLKRSSGGFGNE